MTPSPFVNAEEELGDGEVGVTKFGREEPAITRQIR